MFGAGIFVPFWNAAGSRENLNGTDVAGVPAHIAGSWGYRFTEKLVREIILTRMSSCHVFLA
jgi:hypothetical protein